MCLSKQTLFCNQELQYCSCDDLEDMEAMSDVEENTSMGGTTDEKRPSIHMLKSDPSNQTYEFSETFLEWL